MVNRMQYFMTSAGTDRLFCCSVRGHPSPSPQLATPVPFSSPTLYGAFFPMASTNRAIVQRTFGLNALTASYAHVLSGIQDAKKKAELQLLTYGPEFRYAEYLVLRPLGESRLAAIFVSVLLQLYLGLLFTVTPVRPSSPSTEPLWTVLT